MKHLILILVFLFACGEDDSPVQNELSLVTIRIGTDVLVENSQIGEVGIDRPLLIAMNRPVDESTLDQGIKLFQDGTEINLNFNVSPDLKTMTVTYDPLDYLTTYTLNLTSDLKGLNNESFPGAQFEFETENGKLTIQSVKLNEISLAGSEILQQIPLEFDINIAFSDQLDPSTNFESLISLTRSGVSQPLAFNLAPNQTDLTISTLSELDGLRRYSFSISNSLQSANGFNFSGFSSSFYTQVDSTFKFPEITDEELLTKIQEQTFKYFWDFAHPNSGLARERNTSGDLVTIGGSGFGAMAILVGIERGFITRQEGIDRLETIVNFLDNADRFHGVWPHWMNGNTGSTIPFSSNDDGADLVETAFMIQGLLTVRQYLDDAMPQELAIKNKITDLWEAVEWDWFTQGNQNVLYWHWSENFGWEKNLPIRGWNESLIIYVLAASSPTHAIDLPVYEAGWARNGDMQNGNSYYDIQLPLGPTRGGPLFFAHYSFLGLDPRNLEDQYANYMTQNTNHTLINRAYCIENPQNYVGYGATSWGLTASDNNEGYSAHSPTNDRGVITPTAAISSIPYTPDESMAAIHHFYYLLGDRLWGEYGFYDAFNNTENWVASSYLAIDQGPIILMIENHRSALLWDLFMQDDEVQTGLTTLGFTY